MKNKRLIFAIIFHFCLTVSIINHFVRDPVFFPFVDDWMLGSWGTGATEMSWANLWQTFNGHQYILVKIFSHFLGSFTNWNLFYSAIIGLIIGSIGYFLLIWFQLCRIELNALQFYISFLGLSALALTGRQGQNFFMISCLGWMFAVFFIGSYFCLKSLNDGSRLKKYLLPVVIIMSPMTVALGLIVPIAELVEVSYRIVKDMNFTNLKRNVWKAILATFAVYLSYIYPVFSTSVAPPQNFTSGADSMREFLLNPWHAIKFMLVTIPQPLLQWTIDPKIINIGAEMGILLVGLLIYLIFIRKNKREALADIFYNKFSILAGVCFLFLFFLARYKSLGVAGALEPRYTTGALILFLGMACFFLKYSRYRTIVALAILAAGITTHRIGSPIGKSYYNLRVEQSKEILKCFNQNKDENMTLEHPCFNLVYPGAFISKEEFLVLWNDFKTKDYGFFPYMRSELK